MAAACVPNDKGAAWTGGLAANVQSHYNFSLSINRFIC